jgi:putative oxidoreductase
MFEKLQDPLSFVGRLLLALLFIPAGIGKATGFAGTVGYIASKSLPAPSALAVGAIIVEIGVAVLLLVGWRARWAASVLAGFTLLAALLFHNYWALPAEQQMVQQIMFFKNLAIAGGLLLVAAFGAGRWSLDGRQGGR